MDSTEIQKTILTTNKRADAVRNQQRLLSAAAEVFILSGVDAPLRQIAAKAGVGTATIYRHFPTRADLIAAVFHYQVEECAEAGSTLLANEESPFKALQKWIDRFVDFLVTKHGLASAMQSNNENFIPLQAYFLDRLLPVCNQLLNASKIAGEIRGDIEPYPLLRGIGNLCVGQTDDGRYIPQQLIALVLNGLRCSAPDNQDAN